MKNTGNPDSEYCNYSIIIKKDWPPTIFDIENELRILHPEKDI